LLVDAWLKTFCLTALLAGTAMAPHAMAQNFTPDSDPDLAADSPFRDPDMIYLEADELVNNETERTLTAIGSVEGRYQDRSLRAEQVVYFLDEGRVIASGNVVLVNADGSSQYAETIELSNELETGNATNFTSRLPNGGVTGAAFATRRTDEGVDLYNAYYTACEACAEDDKKKPTWQIRAKRVSQDKSKNMILYKDAVFELFGLPILYTPYLAHPDPSQDRASGWLNPFGGLSGSRGAFIELPYYIDIDDYTELTLTPHLFTKVNPLMEMDFRRRFHSGDLNINSSFTYASAFDRNGDIFTDTDNYEGSIDHVPLGKRLRSHFFADGEFDFSDTLGWGFTAQATTDDLYLRRYGLNAPSKAGLYSGGARRLISQIFGVAQSEDFRFVASAYGFQSLRTNIREIDDTPNTFRISREDDSTLPIIAPKLEASYHLEDPIIGGRIEAFGDFTMLTRDIGTDYSRGTAGAKWSKSFILPAGIEAKPFGEARYDNFDITPYDKAADADLDDVSFSRQTGQVGLDVRWPFIKSTGGVDIIVEPRAMITQSFNLRRNTDTDADFEFDILQDSLEIDFDHNLIWSPNKSTGLDLWQKGFRADVGGSIKALWGDNHTQLFVGQSFADNVEDIFEVESGLKQDKSDLVGQFELGLGGNFLFDTRVRYDDDDNKFRRLDTGFRYISNRLSGNLRYYKIDKAIAASLADLDPLLDASSTPAPAEELTGSASFRLTDNWKVRYSATRDLDQDITRRQSLGFGFEDDCTLIELLYTKYNFQNDAVRDSDSIGIRISLKSLGQFGGDDRNEGY